MYLKWKKEQAFDHCMHGAWLPVAAAGKQKSRALAKKARANWCSSGLVECGILVSSSLLIMQKLIKTKGEMSGRAILILENLLSLASSS